MIVLTIPMPVVNELNDHKHWRVRTRRARDQHGDVTAHLLRWSSRRPLPDLALVVTMTRLSPKSFDSDGTVASMKHVRDAIAKWLCRDDGPGAGVEWVAQWERSSEVLVRIEIAPTPALRRGLA